MKLSHLEINWCEYGENKDSYAGIVRFQGKDGVSSTTLKISRECANKILNLCAEGLIEAAKETSTLLLEGIMKSVPALEHKKE